MNTTKSKMQNPLISLLRQKYGIKHVQKQLKFKFDDSLYKMVKKTAKFIWANGEWSTEDYVQGIKALMLFTFLGDDGFYCKKPSTVYKVDSIKKVDETEADTHLKKYACSKVSKSANSDIRIFKCDYSSMQFQKESAENEQPIMTNDAKLETIYFAIDICNHFTKRRDLEHFWLKYYTIGKNGIRTANKIDCLMANVASLVGYGKLLCDFLQEVGLPVKKQLNDGINIERLNQDALDYCNRNKDSENVGQLVYYQKRLFTRTQLPSADDYSGLQFLTFYRFKAFMWELMKDELFVISKHNSIGNALIAVWTNYLLRTYNITLQEKYERNVDQQVHAKAWETKKNITLATRQLMSSTKLHQYFGNVEIDDEVDLSKFGQLENELMRLMAILPKFKYQPTLRLRKLGNHRALGLYVPFANTIVVDFRTADQIYKSVTSKETRNGKAGYASFIHEYGHFIDYNMKKTGKFSDVLKVTNLSNSDEFSFILMKYQHEVIKYADLFPANKLEYYLTPTEVFARSFELYVSHAGLRSNLLGSQGEYNPKYGESPEYWCFTAPIRQRIYQYFDEVLGFRKIAEQLNQDITISRSSNLELKLNSSTKARKETTKLVPHKVNATLTEFTLF